MFVRPKSGDAPTTACYSMCAVGAGKISESTGSSYECRTADCVTNVHHFGISRFKSRFKSNFCAAEIHLCHFGAHGTDSQPRSNRLRVCVRVSHPKAAPIGLRALDWQTASACGNQR